MFILAVGYTIYTMKKHLELTIFCQGFSKIWWLNACWLKFWDFEKIIIFKVNFSVHRRRHIHFKNIEVYDQQHSMAYIVAKIGLEIQCYYDLHLFLLHNYIQNFFCVYKKRFALPLQYFGQRPITAYTVAKISLQIQCYYNLR